MFVYDFRFSVSDQIEAPSLEAAWEIAKKRIEERWYGPTITSLELIEEYAAEPD